MGFRVGVRVRVRVRMKVRMRVRMRIRVTPVPIDTPKTSTVDVSSFWHIPSTTSSAS